MNRLYTLLLVVIATFHLCIAENVSLETAQSVASNFLASKFGAGKQMVKLKLLNGARMKSSTLYSRANQENPVYYIFTSEANDNFVIVSGDDRCKPILGYSTTNGLTETNLPINFVYWMKGYAEQIEQIRKDSTIKIAKAPEWRTNGISVTTKSTSAVAPLIKTQWHQKPYYNDLCPSAWYGTTVTGCVATAMAQVMRYWKYPIFGIGNHAYNDDTYGTQFANFGNTIYNWSEMPNQLTSSSSSTEVNAVATLMYHCGVSVDMDYGISDNLLNNINRNIGGGSSAYTLESVGLKFGKSSAEYALKTYFGFSSTLTGRQRNNYTQTVWLNLLKTEFNAGRPVIYAGHGTGGHCFIADGYDIDNKIHFNWGWSGSANGNFEINSLNSSSFDFNSDQQAIIGIQPPTNYQDYKLRLYSPLSISKSTIKYGETITASFNVENFGTATFGGNYYIAILNSDGNIIDTAAVVPNKTLSAGYSYTNNISVNIPPRVSMYNGNYFLQLYFAPAESTMWRIVGGGNYVNKTPIAVTYSAPIELYSNFLISPNNKINNTPVIVQGATTYIDFVVQNTSTTTVYNGSVGLFLYDMFTGKNVAFLGSYDNLSLKANGGYKSVYVTFSNINVNPGTYYMMAVYSDTPNPLIVGATTNTNPIKVIIQAAPVPKDSYEPNNTADSAYVLPVSIVGGKATIKTTNATINDGDGDYYKIQLPAGKNYSISAKAQDSYKSTDGISYTCDVAYSMSINGTNLNRSYDSQSDTINVDNGGVVTLNVMPYYPGMTGTYALEITIQELLQQPPVLITQVYGGGGNSGANYKSDFIELLNTTSSDVNIGGWCAYYIAATSSSTSQKYEFLANTIIKAGSYFLLKCADGTGAQPAWSLPFDGTSTLALGGTVGKVILLKSNAAFTLSTPPLIEEIVNNVNFGDYVPYGTTAVPIWGSAMAANTTSTTAVRRKFANGKYQYTQNVGNDFEIVTADPRNSSSPVGVAKLSSENITVYVSHKNLYVKGLNESQRIDIYTTTGCHVNSWNISSSKAIALNNLPVGIYIVKIGRQSFKIKL
ncbi:MAG: C10 family peptidase [Bacteroidales bacterium]